MPGAFSSDLRPVASRRAADALAGVLRAGNCRCTQFKHFNTCDVISLDSFRIQKALIKARTIGTELLAKTARPAAPSDKLCLASTSSMPKGAKRKAKAEAEARAAAEAAGEDEDDDEYDEAPALELQAGEDDDEELQVEFSFFDPRSEDYHAMRAMLSGGALLPEGIDPGGFADLLSEQAVVGTLVKGESIDTDLYGFISALSLQQHKETKCVQQLIASILKRLPDAPAREAVRAWMQDAQAPP